MDEALDKHNSLAMIRFPPQDEKMEIGVYCFLR